MVQNDHKLPSDGLMFLNTPEVADSISPKNKDMPDGSPLYALDLLSSWSKIKTKIKIDYIHSTTLKPLYAAMFKIENMYQI